MPAIVHTTQATATPVTIPATTAGNMLVVCIGQLGGAGLAKPSAVALGGVADNFFDTLADGSGTNGINVTANSSIWLDPNCAGGQTSVAITAGSIAGITIYEVSGVGTTSAALDQKSSGGAASGAYSSGATPATTQASEIWIGCGQLNGTIAGPGAPWSNATAETGVGFVSGNQIVASTGTATYSGASSGIWGASVVTIKASGGVSVNLPVAQYTFQAFPVVPTIPGMVVNLPGPAGVVFNALPVIPKITPELIISIASAAGNDPINNQPYPEGIYQYDPAIGQVTGISGGDLNIAIGTTVIAALNAIANGIGAIFEANAVPGELFISTGGNSLTDSPAQIIMASKNVGGGKRNIALTADSVELTATGATIPVAAIAGFPLPNDANSGTAWASGERAFMNNSWITPINNLYNALVSMGLIQ